MGTENIFLKRMNKKSSEWTPQPGRDHWLDLYIQEVRDDIIKGLKIDCKMNNKARRKSIK